MEIESLRNLYKDTLEDLRYKVDLTIHEIMILESLLNFLEEIKDSSKGYVNPITCFNKQYYIKHKNIDVFNIFKDELGQKIVNPVKYYGVKNIKKLKILELIRDISSKSKYGNINFFNQQEIFEKVLMTILINSDLKIKKYMYLYEYYIKNYYCTSTGKIKENEYLDIEISKENQREIINYILDNYKEDNGDFLESFFINRYAYKYESLRYLILYYIQTEYNITNSVLRENYLDDIRFLQEKHKISFVDSLLDLFSHLYLKVENKKPDNRFEIFKEQIIVNYRLRKLFFDVLDIFIENEGMQSIQKVNTLINKVSKYK